MEVKKRVIATHDSHEQLFKLLEVVVTKRGYGKKKTIFLSDGSAHILERQRRFFPEAIPCLDWCHASEYIWKACSSFNKEGSKGLNQAAQRLKKQMLSGDIDGVLEYLPKKLSEIPKTGPGNKGRRDRLETTINYLDKNKDRLQYADLRKAGLPIGSGVVEGTIRNLVRQRLDCSGMRWGLDRSEHVLHLRCVFRNKQWDDFGKYLEPKDLQLSAQPEKTRPYDAKPMCLQSVSDLQIRRSRSAPNSKARIETLMLIAVIGMLALNVIGNCGEKSDLQKRYQANTVKTHRVLLLFFLGKNMILFGHDDIFGMPDLLLSIRYLKDKLPCLNPNAKSDSLGIT